MTKKKAIILAGALLFIVNGLYAQLYKVYDYQPTEAGEIEFSVWNSYVPSSDLTYSFFGRIPTRYETASEDVAKTSPC